LEEAINLAKNDPHSFVIGGGEIYEQALKYVDSIELTRVHHNFGDADTFFPKIEASIWKLVQEEFHPKDERHAYDFTYLSYVRK
jgi:dihydrofolate reductase